MSGLRLGVNIDHVATLRQARYATMPESKMPSLIHLWRRGFASELVPAESSPICGRIAATFQIAISNVSAQTS